MIWRCSSFRRSRYSATAGRIVASSSPGQCRVGEAALAGEGLGTLLLPQLVGGRLGGQDHDRRRGRILRRVGARRCRRGAWRHMRRAEAAAHCPDAGQPGAPSACGSLRAPRARPRGGPGAHGVIPRLICSLALKVSSRGHRRSSSGAASTAGRRSALPPGLTVTANWYSLRLRASSTSSLASP